MFKKSLLTDTILSDPSWRYQCFAESDAGEAEGGGGEAEAEAQEEEGEEGQEPEGEGQEGAEEPDDDTDELEVGPQKYRIPKPVKEAWNGVQNKMQQAAEETKAEKRAREEDGKRYQENMRFAAAYVDELGQIKSLEAQIKETKYAELTPAQWVQWAQENPDAAKQADLWLSAASRKLNDLKGAIGTKEQELRRRQAEEQTVQERKRQEQMTQAERDVAAKVKGWTPARKEEALSFAQAIGFSPDEIKPYLLDYRVVQIIDEVMSSRAARAKVKQVVQQTRAAQSQASPPPEPMKARIRGGSPTGGAPRLDDKVSMATFKANFLKQRTVHKNTRPR